MSIAIKENDIGILRCQNPASLATFSRCVGDNCNKNGEIFRPYCHNRVLKVRYEFLRRLPFR